MQLTRAQWILGGAGLVALLVYLSKVAVQNTGITNTMMKTSDNGVNQVKKHEGLSLTVYKDVAGLPTIGYGHLIKKGESFTSITESYATMLLKQDLESAEKIVKKFVGVPMSQNQFDSLVSACFNLGQAIFKNADGSKTQLMKAIDAGDWKLAATKLQLFNRAGGVVVAGLSSRRVSEAALMVA